MAIMWLTVAYAWGLVVLFGFGLSELLGVSMLDQAGWVLTAALGLQLRGLARDVARRQRP